MRTKLALLVLLLAILLQPNILAANPMRGRMDDCQPPRKERWILHEGDRLELFGTCHHEEPGDIEPEPPIRTVIRLRPGQRIKVRARLWKQGIRIQCGKPCVIWDMKCEWVGGDIPKGSVYKIVCKE